MMIRMKIIHLERFERAGLRPAGYVTACRDAAIAEKDGVLSFEPAAYAELRDRFGVHGHLPPPRRKTAGGPGTVLAWLIRILTLGLVRPCTTCKSRIRRMDQMGWWGVLTLGTRRNLMPGTRSAINHIMFSR